MEQHKVRTYIFYAFGEIFLVVIGILIALQVSNWNQDRINDISSKDYQQRLLDDLYEELNVIESVMGYAETTMNYALSASSVFEEGTLPSGDGAAGDNFLIDLYQASQIQDASGSSATYKELLSSGQISKITNEALRASIINYYGYDWGKSVVFTVEDPYRQNIRKIIPTPIQMQIRNECGDAYKKSRNSLLVYLKESCELDFDPLIAKPTVRNIMESVSLKSNLRYRISNLYAQIQLVTNYRNELKNIIRELEKEI